MQLLNDIKHCTHCFRHLPLGANPVLQFSAKSKIVIIEQAPGLKVYQCSIPWDDASGERLRNWLNIDATAFYDATKFALVPMGFCYPGKGTSDDLPPRPECAPKWHAALFSTTEHVQLKILNMHRIITCTINNNPHSSKQ